MLYSKISGLLYKWQSHEAKTVRSYTINVGYLQNIFTKAAGLKLKAPGIQVLMWLTENNICLCCNKLNQIHKLCIPWIIWTAFIAR
jgi:hypothetical protein